VIRAWPALLIVPLLALASIALGYALATPACNYGRPWILHASVLFFLLLCIANTVAAWVTFSRARLEFLSLISLWSGVFFCAVLLVQWLALFIVTPCMHSP
jgi:small-conductance mechanosensitive channel